MLKPFGGIACRRLDAQHVDHALRGIGAKRRGHVRAVRVKGASQRDRILQRELGSGADGEMRRMRRVAHQHDVAQDPGRVAHPKEVEPCGTRTRGGTTRKVQVRQQRVSVQPRREHLLTERDRSGGVAPVEARRVPGCFRGLDDERGGVAVEAIRVRLEPAEFRLHEDERERPEHTVRAKPDELVAPEVDRRVEVRGVTAADPAVDAVRGNDQVSVGKLLDVVHFALEDQFHTQCLSASLQDPQQMPARDATKPMAA